MTHKAAVKLFTATQKVRHKKSRLFTNQLHAHVWHLYHVPGGSSILINNKINRCRPGFGASCSFCCGSHNFTVTQESIEEIFISRDLDMKRDRFRHPESSCEPKLVKEGMQCPHMGFSESEPGIVCCLSYNEDHRDSPFRSFFTGTCKTFQCVAWNELTDREVLFAAKLFKDWYYYSLLINSIEILSSLCAEYNRPDDIPDEIIEELKLELIEKLHEDDLI